MKLGPLVLSMAHVGPDRRGSRPPTTDPAEDFARHLEVQAAPRRRRDDSGNSGNNSGWRMKVPKPALWALIALLAGGTAEGVRRWTSHVDAQLEVAIADRTVVKAELAVLTEIAAQHARSLERLNATMERMERNEIEMYKTQYERMGLPAKARKLEEHR